MTDKTIKELIEEAREFSYDIHDHVALEMFGGLDKSARHRAKQMVLCYLYGGTGDVAAKPAPNHSWKMTQEQIEAQSKATSLEFKQLWMGEPFKVHDEVPVMPMHSAAYLRSMSKHPQAEDRMHRGGVLPYKVDVLDANTDFPGCSSRRTCYTIHATSALDARCMAFVLDGGCQSGLKHWDDGHIELALEHTEIVE